MGGAREKIGGLELPSRALALPLRPPGEILMMIKCPLVTVD